MRILRTCFVLALLAALATGALYAQAVNGTIVGNVTDASGAAVPSAKVTVTEMKTGVGRSGETNESGNFVFPNMEPGTYKVAVERTGFRTAVKEGVELLVNTTARVDLILQPGQVNESVTI